MRALTQPKEMNYNSTSFFVGDNAVTSKTGRELGSKEPPRRTSKRISRVAAGLDHRVPADPCHGRRVYGCLEGRSCNQEGLDRFPGRTSDDDC